MNGSPRFLHESGYDKIGQLIGAHGKESGGTTNRLHEQFGYGYDAGHNLSLRTNNALVQTFTVNALNELSNATRTGTFTVAGATTSAATNVTVNGSNAVLYGDFSFAKDGFSLTNGNNSYTAIGRDALGRLDTNTVTVNLPSTVAFTYDLNGNLLSDGKRGFDYDEDNQLIRVTITNATKSEFVYDAAQRMRIRKEFNWNGSWNLNSETRYVYDGSLVLQERDGNNLPRITYTRGRDLSGGLQGAGGIGGLLARTDNSVLQVDSANAHAFYHADGSGNITAIVNSGQVPVGNYAYDPFGNLLSQSGPLAEANVYRFTSKEFHPNSGLYYYGFRFYDPTLQRWLNQDPIGEVGGINLYGFVANGSPNKIDLFGLDQAHWWNVSLLWDQEALSTWKRGLGTGLYDWAMGNPGKGNPMTQGAMRAEMLEGIDIHDNLLRDAMGGTTEVAGDLVQEAIEQYVGGRLGAAGVGVGGKLFCKLKGPAGVAGGAEALTDDALRFQKAGKGPLHHLATDKNLISDLRGGPWTPRFEAIFKKAGMTLQDAANKVRIPGHIGPHPEAYHQAIFDRLTAATSGLSGSAYRTALESELSAVASEAQTAGTSLNKLLMGQ